ncbi:MAG: molybdate ABC transporter substrate-binding protein [Microthrixaceae bacterium]
MLRSGLLALLALVALPTSACGGVGGGADMVSGSVVVLAASSMREAMTAVAADFEDAHPGTEVALTFDGSSGLAAAIIEGAPGDVFVSADDETMGRVQRSGAATTMAVTIASNDLQIAVAEGNPLGIQGLADLDGVVVSLCRREVSCGAYAEELFSRAGVAVPDAGRESNVKAVVTKVQLGEADAGIVYRTDVLQATGIAGVEVPAHQRVEARYSAIALTEAPNPRGAGAFITFLSGREARATLRAAGFGPP